VFARVAGVFYRAEPRRRARSYLTGLLAPVERKNSWQLSEAAGEVGPARLQHFLNRSRWDADELRDCLRRMSLGRWPARMVSWCRMRPDL
jgi:SRSO17 transposase